VWWSFGLSGHARQRRLRQEQEQQIPLSEASGRHRAQGLLLPLSAASVCVGLGGHEVHELLRSVEMDLQVREEVGPLRSAQGGLLGRGHLRRRQ